MRNLMPKYINAGSPLCYTYHHLKQDVKAKAGIIRNDNAEYTVLQNTISANIGMFAEDSDDNEADDVIFYLDNTKQPSLFTAAINNTVLTGKPEFIYL